MISGSSDSIFVCVHTMPKICTPCTSDSQCTSTQTDRIAVCAGDDNGRFCGGQCETDVSCPQNYVCQEVQGTSGSTIKQCVPASGTCTCSKRAIESGSNTICVIENLIGRCTGEIRCTEAGMEACPALTPAEESCNKIDDDCNDTTDDVTVTACLVRNPFGQCPGTTLCTAGTETCQGPQAAQEVCNGWDDNCSGTTDEENSSGCSAYYMDFDSDTWGDTADMKCLCDATGHYTATRGGDCNDGNLDINPGKAEECNGVDDNCSGATDEEGTPGCRHYYYDLDRDSYGTTATPKCLCVASYPWSALRTGDCNDSEAGINPGMAETCNTKDDNCDTVTDPIDSLNCTPFFYDNDGDNYGSTSVASKCQCGPNYITKFKVQAGGDCNDSVSTIGPAAREKCDGIDNNCDGDTDENGAQNCVPRYADRDGDGFGTGTSQCSCTEVAPYTAEVAGDCNDNEFYVNPDADEICNDTIDNDCNSKTDEENGVGCEPWYYDGDRDGFGNITRVKCLCAASAVTRYDAVAGSDCNDALPSVSPGMREACGNGVDDNCNAATDEENGLDCSFYYYDGDGDTYGITSIKKCLCAALDLYRATVGGDCDDSAASSYPGGTETCAAGDQNCDGTDNEENADGCSPFYFDGDADEYGRDDLATRCFCSASISTGYRAPVGGDCRDADNAINPGKIEVCEPDGTTPIDNNCNGFLNEENATGCKNYFYDGDRDGHGLTGSAYKCYCTGGNVGLRYTSLLADDCNDSDATISGGLPELCDDKDNNCNGNTDEDNASDCTIYYFDNDRDGYGYTSLSECKCVPDIAGRFDTTVPDDCNDDNSSIYPGNSVCGYDGNCDLILLDPLEECDDGNSIEWDGCTQCLISEVRINGQVSDEQSWPSAAATSDGKWAVTYSTVRNTTGEDIAIRILNSNGTTSSSEMIAATYNANTQSHPDIAALSDSLVLVWESFGEDGDNYGIAARIMNNDGTPKYPEFLINGTTSGSQSKAAVAVGPSDKIITVWQSGVQDGSFEGVYGRMHTTPGTAATGETLIPQTTVGSQSNPDVASYPAGSKFVVTWTSQVTVTPGTDTRIFFRIFDMDFTPLTNEVQVTNSGTNLVGQDKSAVASLGSAGFVVAFEDNSVDGNDKGIRYRAFDWAGNALGAPALANTTTANMQAAPSVAALSTSTFIIAWWSNFQDSDGTGAAVARKFVIGGTNGNEQILNNYKPSYQWYVSLAIAGTKWLATWMSSQQDSSGSGVYGRVFE